MTAAADDEQGAPLIVVTGGDAAPLAKLAEGYVRAVAEQVAAAKATNTTRAYSADFRQFQAWCESMALPSLPAAVPTVAAYLAHLRGEGLKTSSIRRALSGIAFFQRKNGYDWESPRLIREQIAGMRRLRADRTTKKAALTDDLLRAIVSTCDESPAGIRNRALFTVGWVTASRRSELVALDVEHVTEQPEGFVVWIGRSKTDQAGIGFEKAVPHASDPRICPVRALRAWLGASGIDSGAIFRRVARSGAVLAGRLTDRSVAEIVKTAAKRAHLDPSAFSGHSLRAGFVTTAARQNRSIPEIMAQTGHRDVGIVTDYIRHASIFTKNAAKGLI